MIPGRRVALLAASALAAACASAPAPLGGVSHARLAPADSARARFGDTASLVVAPDTVEVVRGHGPFYPTDEEVEGEEAALIVAFVVDTTGAVEPATISFLRQDLPPFTRSVCDYLGRVRFAPVTRDSVPRRALVLKGYVFQLVGGDYDGGHIELGQIREVARREPVGQLLRELAAMPHCPHAAADSAAASRRPAP